MNLFFEPVIKSNEAMTKAIEFDGRETTRTVHEKADINKLTDDTQKNGTYINSSC